ncbi:NAD(P)-dependent oxidoreductase [Fundidesulfovibrio terrae]|uniref:NAD(P)-dependent oxidoreductase n=1 Tax=Fundidesulfovibrio terrae TaxID=2922866 RepID=UPI001FAFA3C6|nr:NAD(P)-dependent oxidoreductase [Fundidesulfovibrio terrae]
MKPKVGFAGMGIMGKPMAHNIVKAGFAVSVYNRTKPQPDDVAGAYVADTPLALARENDVLVIMVTGPKAIEAILWGEDGMAAALGQGKKVVNMSTVSPEYTAQIAAKVEATGAVFVDAPVSGSKIPAQQGTLVVLAGGPKDEVEALEPIFAAMGKKTVYCGPAPQGSMMKMAVNLLLSNMMCGLSEMLTFGKAGGLSAETMLEVVLGGPMGCDLFKIKEPLITQRKFLAQFPLKHMAKDLKFVTDTACALRCPAPSAFANLQLFNQGMSKGMGELDFAAVIEVLEGMI